MLHFIYSKIQNRNRQRFIFRPFQLKFVQFILYKYKSYIVIQPYHLMDENFIVKNINALTSRIKYYMKFKLLEPLKLHTAAENTFFFLKYYQVFRYTKLLILLLTLLSI